MPTFPQLVRSPFGGAVRIVNEADANF